MFLERARNRIEILLQRQLRSIERFLDASHVKTRVHRPLGRSIDIGQRAFYEERASVFG